MTNMSQNMVNGGCNGNPLRNEVEPAARKILRTDQPTILARTGHVNRPPFASPLRWHPSVGETVWRFEVAGIVVFFFVRIYYPTNAIYQWFSRILAVGCCAIHYAKRS
jgi:hypothetical protein